MVGWVSVFSEITHGIIFFLFVALVVVSRISDPNTKLSSEISQEVSLDVLACLRSRFFTLRVQNEVKCGYQLRRQEWFIEFRFSRKSHAELFFSCLLRWCLCPNKSSYYHTKLWNKSRSVAQCFGWSQVEIFYLEGTKQSQIGLLITQAGMFCRVSLFRGITHWISIAGLFCWCVILFLT